MAEQRLAIILDARGDAVIAEFDEVTGAIKKTHKASDLLGKQADQTGESVERMGKKSGTAGKRLKQLERGANQTHRILTKVAGTVAKAAGLIGVTLGAGMGIGIARTIEWGSRLEKLERRIGLSTESASQLAHVAELSGVSFDTMAMALQRQTRRVAEAAAGMGEARGALRELNIDAAAFNALSPDEQLLILADRLANVGTESDRVRLAMRLWDSEGVAMLQTIEGGSDAMREMMEQAHALGLTISKDQAAAMAEAEDAGIRLQASVAGLATTLTTQLAPALSNVLDWMADEIIPSFAEWLDWIGAIDLAISQLTLDQLLSRRESLRDQLRLDALVIDSWSALPEAIQDLNPALDDAKKRFAENAQEMARVQGRINELSVDTITAADVAAAHAAAQGDVSEATSNAAASFASESVEIQKFVDGLRVATTQVGQSEEATLRAEAANIKAALSNAELADEVDALVESYLEAKAAAEDRAAAEEELNQILADAAERAIANLRHNNEYVESLRDELYLLRLTDAEREIEIALRQLASNATDDQKREVIALVQAIQQERAAREEAEAVTQRTIDLADDYGQEWNAVIGRIDAAFQGMWEDFLRNGELSMDGIKDLFYQLLAELIHAATTQQILLSLNIGGQGLGGLGSFGSAGGQGIFGQAINSGITAGINWASGALFGGTISGLSAFGAGTATVGSTAVLAAPTLGGTAVPVGLGSVGSGSAAAGGASGLGALGPYAAIAVALWAIYDQILSDRPTESYVLNDPPPGQVGPTADRVDTPFDVDTYIQSGRGDFDENWQDLYVQAFESVDWSFFDAIMTGAGEEWGSALVASISDILSDSGQYHIDEFNVDNPEVALQTRVDQMLEAFDPVVALFVRGTGAIGRSGTSPPGDGVGPGEYPTGKPKDLEEAIDIYGDAIDLLNVGSFELHEQALRLRDALLIVSAVMDDTAIINGEGAVLEIFNLITEFAGDGEAVIDTYNRLAQANALLSSAVELTGVHLEQTGADFVRFAMGIVEQAGGIERAQQLWNSFFDTFFTQEERLQLQASQVREAATAEFADIGLTSEDLERFIGDPQAFRALFEEMLPSLSEEAVVQWLEAGEALGVVLDLEGELARLRGEEVATSVEGQRQALEAQLEADQAYRDFMRGIQEEIDGVSGSGFVQEMREIDQTLAANIRRANELAQAAGYQGASEQDLARMHQLAAQQAAAAIARLRSAAEDLAAELYGTPLSQLEDQIAALEAQQVQGFSNVGSAATDFYDNQLASIQQLDDYINSFLLGDLSSLTPEERLNEARAQYEATLAAANAGDADAFNNLGRVHQAYLREVRDFYKSGAQGDEIETATLDELRAIRDLWASGAFGSGGGSGGAGGLGGGGGVSPELQALYDRRDALLEEQTAQHRLELAIALAEHVRLLSSAIGDPVVDILSGMGVEMSQLLADLGINVEEVTDQTVLELANVANALGMELSEIASSVGISLGDLADQQSLVSQGFMDTLATLPPEIQGELGPLLDRIWGATTAADANAAIADLEQITGELPIQYRDLLAPYFDDIDPTDPLQEQLSVLGEIERLSGIADTRLGNIESTSAAASGFAADAATDLGRIADMISASNNAAGLPVYHTGIAYVPRTGPAVLEEGEMVLNRVQAARVRYGRPPSATVEPGALPIIKQLTEDLIREVEDLKDTVIDQSERNRDTWVTSLQDHGEKTADAIGDMDLHRTSRSGVGCGG